MNGVTTISKMLCLDIDINLDTFREKTLYF